MFQKFTERARIVINIAQQEALRLNNEFIGTEHILLGIVEVGGGIAAKVLKNLNVDFERVRQEIERLIQQNPNPGVTLGHLPFSPRAKRVLELAQESATQLGHDVIGTEHLLLGLLKENEGIAALVLRNFGVRVQEVHEMVIDLLGKEDRVPTGLSLRTLQRRPQFTAKLLEVHRRATSEAESRGCGSVETQHVLIAMVEDGECAAVKLLAAAKVDLSIVKVNAEALCVTRPHVSGRAAPVAEVTRLNYLAEQIVGGRDSAKIGTHHFLSAMLGLHECRACVALEQSGVRAEVVAAMLAKFDET